MDIRRKQHDSKPAKFNGKMTIKQEKLMVIVNALLIAENPEKQIISELILLLENQHPVGKSCQLPMLCEKDCQQNVYLL